LCIENVGEPFQDSAIKENRSGHEAARAAVPHASAEAEAAFRVAATREASHALDDAIRRAGAKSLESELAIDRITPNAIEIARVLIV
jgi:hypothetical protein